MRFKKNNKGFTLIELLAVMALISLLSSLVLAFTQSARMKARDAKRIADLEQIRLTLYLYFNENNRFPSTADNGRAYSQNLGNAPGPNANWDDLFSSSKLGKFMEQVPKDPKNTAIGSQWPGNSGVYTYSYGTDPNGKDYELVARLEDAGSPYRCGIKQWIAHISGGVPFCPTYDADGLLYADH